jgi:hypothetical protein
MSTPAFRPFIAINTPSLDERTRQITATTLGVDHHISELQQVATDLRIERSLAAPRPSGPNRFRIAIGTALVNLGSAVAASPKPGTQAR